MEQLIYKFTERGIIKENATNKQKQRKPNNREKEREQVE